jgi:polyisoprenyl-teichoic acid--peptidoglycan teichoic acid transferase
MSTQVHGKVRGGRGHPAVLPGILLGSLLTLFLITFAYSTYQFVLWGRATVGMAPKMPPLPVPRLVRAAPVEDTSVSGGLGMFSQPGTTHAPEAAPALTGRVTVLLMGVDARPDEKVSRTDTILVLTVNPKARAAGMLSFARDLLVPVPGWNESIKVNSVHVYGEVNKYPGGGPALLRNTLQEMIGYPIDYYVRLNFDGFREIVDLVGGVDIDVAKEIDDPLYPDENYGYDPLHIPAGRQHMDGQLALKYARTRHADSDYGRARRQQQVILAIKDKLMQPGQLATLVPRLPGLILAMASSVQTDMPADKAIALARSIGQVDIRNPTQVVVDNSLGAEANDPTWGFVLEPDMYRVHAAVNTVFADVASGPSPAELARKAIQDESARVVVLNGTSEENIAAKTAAALVGDGFNVVAVGNAERADYAGTWLITHGDEKANAREALVRRYNIPPDRIGSEPPSDSADLTLIVGSDQMPVQVKAGS